MRLRRLLTICHTAARYRLDTLLEREGTPLWLRLLLRIGPWRLVPVGERSRGERLRLALESLGPIFIKFGQLLSTRRDLLPPDVADELAKLQDQVPPFPDEVAVALIEKALGAPVDSLFAAFSTAPLASASVAQVHAATLKSGEAVVVKVIRPDIESIIRQDIDLLYTLAHFLRRYVPDGRRLRPVEVVEGYEHTVFDELDLQREGANTAQLKRNFANSDQLYIPAVYWDYTRRNVLTLERISGIPVTDVAALQAAGTDMKALAELGVEIFFAQVFRDNFFHADMHPGNIFVDVTDPARPSYIGIDCAIIGSLTESDQYYIARNLLAIFRRNYREVAELHLESGWIAPQTKVHEFEGAIRSACEPIFEKPLGEISFAQLLIYLFQTARRFDMEVQPSLVLLQKTLINIEGLGRQLYPELDLWHTAYPYLEEWLYERYSPTSMARKLWRRLPGWLEHLPRVPDQLFQQLERGGELERRALEQEQQLAQLERQLKREGRRSRTLLLAVTAVLGAVLVPLIGEGWSELPAASWLLLGIAAAALLKL